MAGNTLRYLPLAFATILASFTAWASIPPPPVNQYLGIPDIRFKQMTSHTCLGCHGDPANAVAPVKTGYLPDRHHLRIDTPIGEYSASPYPEKSPDGKHKCLTCHLLDWVTDSSQPAGGVFRFSKNRDCMTCHTQKENQRGELIATVHHLTDSAQQANCHVCHGSLIDNPNDDHRIPDPASYPDDEESHYDISLTTPWPGAGFYNSRVQLRSALEASFSYKLDIPFSPTEEQIRKKEQAEAQINYILENFDPPIGETGRRMGNCAYCHFSGTDDVTGKSININYVNHHGTGVGQPGSGSVHGCGLCHQPYVPPDFTIRGCERCHGISSLHSIEYDANGDGIVVGEEEPYFGHIGNPKNCDGCHKNSQNEMVAISMDFPFASTAVIPGISGINETSITANSQTRLILTGSGFIDTPVSERVESGERSTWLRLIRIDGTTIDISPDLLSATHMEVALPADLESGSYSLAVAKSGGAFDTSLISTTINFLIKPDVTIDGIACSANIITITGSAFGGHLNSEGSGTAVTTGADLKACAVNSWTDSKIIADCSSGIGDSIQVDGVFGTATADVECGTATSSHDQPNWWSIWSWWASWSWSIR